MINKTNTIEKRNFNVETTKLLNIEGLLFRINKPSAIEKEI